MESYNNINISDFQSKSGRVQFAFFSNDKTVAIEYFENNKGVSYLGIPIQNFEFDFEDMQCTAVINGEFKFNDVCKTGNCKQGSITFKHDKTGQAITVPLYNISQGIYKVTEFMQQQGNQLEEERRKKIEEEENKGNKSNEFNLLNQPNTHRRERNNGGKLKKQQPKKNSNKQEQPQNQGENNAGFLGKIRNTLSNIPGLGRLAKYIIPAAVVVSVAYLLSGRDAKNEKLKNNFDDYNPLIKPESNQNEQKEMLFKNTKCEPGFEELCEEIEKINRPITATEKKWAEMTIEKNLNTVTNAKTKDKTLSPK
ncbi:MAG: hypothetical protein RL208_374 [Pseudomonadota bacterium]|jgi:hypothetical protein